MTKLIAIKYHLDLMNFYCLVRLCILVLNLVSGSVSLSVWVWRRDFTQTQFKVWQNKPHSSFGDKQQ